MTDHRPHMRTAFVAVLLLCPATPAIAQIPIVSPYGPGGDSALRVQVTPRDAEVFVDGVPVGFVDQFDGFFQRLHLPSGPHEIEIYREGYRSVRQKLYLTPGATLRVRYDMEALEAGDVPDARPVERLPAPLPGGEGGPLDGFGSIVVRVQPADAEVLIDGEVWESVAPGSGLVVEVPAGRHRVEVRRDGMPTWERTVDVRPGEAVTLNVSLDTEE